MSPKSNARLGALATGLAIASAVIVPAGSVNAAEGDTVRISVDGGGAQGNGASYSSDSISSNGRYVAFESLASNLVPGDTNNRQDVFLHDTATGATVLVSVDSAGTQGNDVSAISSVSPDGRYVAFQSLASNLVAGDTNGLLDVFMHDTATGNTTRLSVDSDGIEANGESSLPSVSSAGRYVVFQSEATNLVANDTNVVTDVFLHDTTTGTTRRLSVNGSGSQGVLGSSLASITPDGRYVVFQSRASNLVAGDTNARIDVFVHDTTTGGTKRVSVNDAGSQTNDDAVGSSISANGLYVAFHSEATNLVPDDTNLKADVFVHHILRRTTARVSVDSSGHQGTDHSTAAKLAADGSDVVFLSAAPNLVANDTNDAWDTFVHDTATGSTTRVSVDSAGKEANGWSQTPQISDDGRFVSFYAIASNLVTSDTNATEDVFVHHRLPTSNPPNEGFFSDDNGSVFENAIDAIARAGITSGCNPPVNDHYCPKQPVTRGEMAAFLTRALRLPHSTTDFFTDDDGSVFERAVNALARTGITVGCNPQQTGDRYCPERRMTRGEMAAMLNRAFQYPPASPGPQPDRFTDDTGHMFEPAINLIAAAKLTLGCNPPVNDRFCPNDHVTRGQMAAFLARALQLP